MTQVDENLLENNSRIPSTVALDTARSHEELDALALEHAKYFTVVQVQLGGFFTSRKSNYIRREMPNIVAARELAEALYKSNGKICMIYAVVDFVGANDFARHMENFPPSVSPFRSKQRRDSLVSKHPATAETIPSRSRILP